jgi:hypothetical protein
MPYLFAARSEIFTKLKLYMRFDVLTAVNIESRVSFGCDFR